MSKIFSFVMFLFIFIQSSVAFSGELKKGDLVIDSFGTMGIVRRVDKDSKKALIQFANQWKLMATSELTHSQASISDWMKEQELACKLTNGSWNSISEECYPVAQAVKPRPSDEEIRAEVQKCFRTKGFLHVGRSYEILADGTVKCIYNPAISAGPI